MQMKCYTKLFWEFWNYFNCKDFINTDIGIGKKMILFVVCLSLWCRWRYISWQQNLTINHFFLRFSNIERKRALKYFLMFLALSNSRIKYSLYSPSFHLFLPSPPVSFALRYHASNLGIFSLHDWNEVTPESNRYSHSTQSPLHAIAPREWLELLTHADLLPLVPYQIYLPPSSILIIACIKSVSALHPLS